MRQPSDVLAEVHVRLPEEPVAQTVGQRVAGMIRDAIVRGELAAGQYLRQEELADRYHISRIPLRDALQQLEKDGYVVILPYRGAAVAPISGAELHEIVDLMAALHALTLRMAFPQLTPETLDCAELLGVARKQATETLQWARLSVDYWSALLRPASRPLLFSMLNTLHSHCFRYASYYYPVWMENERLKNLYVDTIRACREGDLEGAVQVIQQGYGLGLDQLIARLPEVVGPGANLAEAAQDLPPDRGARKRPRGPHRRGSASSPP